MIIKKADYSHIGGKLSNEDSISCEVINNCATYAVVADGVGGHGDGSIASKIAIRSFSKCSYCQTLPSDLQIYQWFQEANKEIINKNQSASGMRTTVVFLAVYDSSAIWAHIGDSRLYHFYAGELADFTCDHSVSQMQVLMGEITRDQIPFNPDRNKILRALGSEPLEAEIHPAIRLQPGKHAFLLCSDGFWEYLTDAEIQLDLFKSDTPEAWLTYLRCRGDVRKNMDADNNSAIAIFAEV